MSHCVRKEVEELKTEKVKEENEKALQFKIVNVEHIKGFCSRDYITRLMLLSSSLPNIKNTKRTMFSRVFDMAKSSYMLNDIRDEIFDYYPSLSPTWNSRPPNSNPMQMSLHIQLHSIYQVCIKNRLFVSVSHSHSFRYWILYYPLIMVYVPY